MTLPSAGGAGLGGQIRREGATRADLPFDERDRLRAADWRLAALLTTRGPRW